MQRPAKVGGAHLQAALDALVAGLSGQFADALLEIRLFGSQARGDAHAESDVDVALILSQGVAEDRQARILEAANASWNLSLGRALGPFLIAYEDFRRFQETRCLLYRDLRDQGVALWASDGSDTGLWDEEGVPIVSRVNDARHELSPSGGKVAECPAQPGGLQLRPGGV